MRTSEVAKLLSIRGDAVRQIDRLATRSGLACPIGSGTARQWSPGDALAMWIMHSLSDGKGSTTFRFAEGARKAGEALDNSYPPAYLVTRGGAEYVVVIESEHPAQTDEMVAALLLQANDAGTAVRVVRLRGMVAQLRPFCAELVDV